MRGIMFKECKLENRKLINSNDTLSPLIKSNSRDIINTLYHLSADILVFGFLFFFLVTVKDIILPIKDAYFGEITCPI